MKPAAPAQMSPPSVGEGWPFAIKKKTKAPAKAISSEKLDGFVAARPELFDPEDLVPQLLVAIAASA